MAIHQGDRSKAAESWVSATLTRIKSACADSTESDLASRKSLLIATAEGALLARAAIANRVVREALTKEYKDLTGLKFSLKKVDLAVAVLARGARDPTMRAKAGKMGRAIGRLRPMQLRTVTDLVAYMEECGGIEGLLAQKSPPPLSPYELIVACTPEELIDVLNHAGGTATLTVKICLVKHGGPTPVQLLSVVVDDPFGEPFNDRETGDNHDDGSFGDDVPTPMPMTLRPGSRGQETLKA